VPVGVVKLAHTSVWHPSRWEGWTDTGEIILVRFRYGHLWIGLTPDFMSVPTTVLAAHCGCHDCGYLAFKQVREHSVGLVEWPRGRQARSLPPPPRDDRIHHNG
jgi:hypothetical protein